ncbi:MAG: FKBP-type peptidyl-prolyl cis-trans isomerase [Bacteroidaceae bacterium]|nr:FKBP-type peptidyl-prolyl cis-trans isomerase [Bacteroidaceae bacterium]
MLKKFFMPLVALFLILGATSCSEQDEVSEFNNWQERNKHFIDSIAHVAEENADGSWAIFKAFTIGDSLGIDDNPNYYVYAQKLEKGTGTYSPLYTDSVRVHYSGRLIPTETYPHGFNFGKSYSSSTLNESTDVPTIMAVSQNIVGFSTALMRMVEGDRWKIYIPYYLGYGKNDYSSANIPGYSTLVFDVKLARIYRFKVDTDTSWH